MAAANWTSSMRRNTLSERSYQLHGATHRAAAGQNGRGRWQGAAAGGAGRSALLLLAVRGRQEAHPWWSMCCLSSSTGGWAPYTSKAGMLRSSTKMTHCEVRDRRQEWVWQEALWHCVAARRGGGSQPADRRLAVMSAAASLTPHTTNLSSRAHLHAVGWAVHPLAPLVQLVVNDVLHLGQAQGGAAGPGTETQRSHTVDARGG